MTMNPSPSWFDEHDDHDPVIDGLVRDHLDRMADSVDGPAFLQQVRGRMVSRTRQPWWNRPTRRAAMVATAASLAGAGLLWFWPTPEATADELIREAKAALAVQPRDRHYTIETVWEDWIAAKFPALRLPSRAELWTRGDAFWLEKVGPASHLSTPIRSWGRDPAGRLWVSPNPRVCLILEPEDIPEPLALITDFYRLEMESLLGEVLARFQLSREPGPGSLVRVIARPRPVHFGGRANPRLREIRLLVEPHERTVREVVVERNASHQLGATVTFTLVETTDLPSERYEYNAHIEPETRVFDLGRLRPPRREQLLRLHLGRMLV